MSFVFTPTNPLSPASVIGPILDRLDQSLTSAGIAVSHLKMMDCSSSGWLKASICTNGAEAVVDGDLDASPAETHDVLLNLRATGNPVQVQGIVEEELAFFQGKVSKIALDCFSPAPPKPERKFV